VVHLECVSAVAYELHLIKYYKKHEAA
jgi:hypothetical protein